MAKVLVFAEVVDGVVADVTYELLDLARHVGDEVVALAIGPEDVLETLGLADRALWQPGEGYRPDVLTAQLVTAMAAEQPELVLVGSTAVGMDVATAAAALSGYRSLAYVGALARSDGAWRARSVILGGKLWAECDVPNRSLLQVLPGVGDAERGRKPARPPAVDGLGPAPATQVAFRGFLQPAGEEEVDITRQEVLVSVGRGIGDAANIELAEELARVLGGVVASSRPVVDAGWLPKARQVGKSGNKVKPRLYLALGISGAPEHIEGMKDAECIVAVNTDPRAPIFEVAHYGVVEDVLDFIPALTEAIQQRRG